MSAATVGNSVKSSVPQRPDPIPHTSHVLRSSFYYINK